MLTLRLETDFFEVYENKKFKTFDELPAKDLNKFLSEFPEYENGVLREMIIQKLSTK